MRTRSAHVMTLVAVAATLVVSCDDDDRSTATTTGGLSTLEEWCTMIGDVDEQFAAADNGDGDFASKRPAYANIRQSISTLNDSIGLVPLDARDDVSAALEFAGSMAAVLSESETIEEAEKNMEPLFAVEEDPIAGAQPWILETCQVDID